MPNENDNESPNTSLRRAIATLDALNRMKTAGMTPNAYRQWVARRDAAALAVEAARKNS